MMYTHLLYMKFCSDSVVYVVPCRSFVVLVFVHLALHDIVISVM